MSCRKSPIKGLKKIINSTSHLQMKAREEYKEKMKNALVITEPVDVPRRGGRGRKRDMEILSDGSGGGSGNEGGEPKMKKARGRKKKENTG